MRKRFLDWWTSGPSYYEARQDLGRAVEDLKREIKAAAAGDLRAATTTIRNFLQKFKK